MKFRRQHVLHGFIVDFYCGAERLVVGLEGDVHDPCEQQTYDAARAAFLKAAGYRVVRVRNRDVTREHLERVLREALQRPVVVPPLPKGEGQGVRPKKGGTGGEDYEEGDRGWEHGEGDRVCGHGEAAKA